MRVINSMERGEEIETIKTILLSLLIVMAVLVTISSSQAVKADLFSDTIKKLGDAISNDTARCVEETGKTYTQCHDEVMRLKP